MSWFDKTHRLYGAWLLFLVGGQAVAVEFGRASISIISAGRVIDYTVEVAADDDSRRQGLMNRKSLPAAHGMLLRYPKPQPVSIWMRNTWLPLDILYIDASGVIVKIIEGAVPHSLTAMPSGQKVLAVLELNAGQVAKQQISIGDKVINF